LQSRQLADWVVAAKQKENVGQELSLVHSSRDNFALSEEEQEHGKQNSYYLDGRRRDPRDAGTAKIRTNNTLGHDREATSLSFSARYAFTIPWFASAS
jgi:hypothetical protein